ncbi:hypothetical protein PIB30_068368 [Stylosanthes scabra]|uniref:Uncharacterized protein n=1 Tax=Stylosanthes scabra TaxID=79078 RepID=A0ABU6YL19_9FABA|nr:hypothetical protein [Stylosanthes scabra]
MALAWPRSELSHIRPKLHKCVARSRPSLGARAWSCIRTMAVARPRPGTWCPRTNYWKIHAPTPLRPRARTSPLRHVFRPPFDRAPTSLPWRAHATAPAPLNRIHSLSLSFSLSFLISSQILSSSNLSSYSHTTTSTLILCVKPRLPRIAKMDHKRKSEDAKRKGKLAMTPTRKSPRLAGLLPFVPPASPKSVLRSNKLLVLAIAAAKGERNAKRIIARGGPSRPKSKKAVVIDLVSDEEEEARDNETATEKPPLVGNQAEEEEDPEEYPPPYSPLPPFPPSPELGPGEYDDPHNWNFDGDLDQWSTDVVGGEPAAAHDWDSTEEEEEDRSTSSDSTD